MQSILGTAAFLYHRYYAQNTEPIKDKNNTPELMAFANDVIADVPGPYAYYTEEMLEVCRQIVAFMPGDNSDLDVSKLRPENLVEILKERLVNFFHSEIKFDNDYRKHRQILWKAFRTALNAIDLCSTVMQMAEVWKYLNPMKKEMVIHNFLSLQSTLLEISFDIDTKAWIFNEYYKEKGEQITPKFQLDDYFLYQKIIDSILAGKFRLDHAKQPWIKAKYRLLQHNILEFIHNETHLGAIRVFKRGARWTAQDYEVVSTFLVISETTDCDYDIKQGLIKKLRAILLRTLLYGVPESIDCEFRSAEEAESLFSLDPEAFRATSKTHFLKVLEELSRDKHPKEDAPFNVIMYFFDYELIPLIEQFNQIMSASSNEVRKNYHQFKVNILRKIRDCINSEHLMALLKPKNVAKTCWLCVSEMADIHDKQRQDEIKPIIVGILQATIKKENVLWYQRNANVSERNKIRASEEKYLMLPDLNKFLGVCISLLTLDSVEKITSEKIDFSEDPRFNDLVANSICSRESVWSGKGTAFLPYIKHPDISCFFWDYLAYQDAFTKRGAADKSITIYGQIIPYHSSVVPEDVIEDIKNDISISSKAVKAILLGFYCGCTEDSSLLKHWKEDWVPAVLRSHPELAEQPIALFKHYFSENFDQHFQLFIQNIERDFGPPDVFFKIEEKLIPSHVEVLKSYCNLLGPNYLSALFSGKYEKHEVIDLDRLTLTHKGASLLLMDIYQGHMDLAHASILTFRDEHKSICEYLFPVTEYSILLQKCIDDKHLYQLFHLRLEHFLKTKLFPNTTPSVLADGLADLYVRYSQGELIPICEMAFRIAIEKKIRILGDAANLMDLIQQKAYAKLNSTSIYQYSKEEVYHYFRYKAEHLVEEFNLFYNSMRDEVFPLGEKGRALFRKEAFNYMRSIFASEEMTYREFYSYLSQLVRLLSFADVKVVTAQENSIIVEMVKTLPGKLPKLMLDNDYNIDLKNRVVKVWTELNQKLGTNIPFDIDFGLEALE